MRGAKRRQNFITRFSEELFTNSPIGMYIIQGGQFQFVNPKFQELTGYTQDELIGMNSLDLVIPEDRILVRENAIQMLNRRRTTPYRYRGTIKNGELRWILETVTSVSYQDRRAVLGYYMDITEHKQAEDELMRSERKYRTLFEESRDVIIITTRDGKLLDVNQAGSEVFGYSREKLIGMDFKNLYVNPDERLEIINEIERAGSIRDYPVKYRNRDGTEFQVLLTASLRRADDGSTQGFQGIIRDITKDKQAQEELLKSERKYRTLFEENRDAILITSREGKVIDANQAASDLFGYSQKEMRGMDINKIYCNPHDRQALVGEVMKHEFVRNYEVKFRKKDGTEIEVLTTTHVWRAEDGSILGYQGIIHDITERKRMEQELRTSREELRNLTQHLQTVREKERAGNAREIHDELGQALTALKMDLSWLTSKLPVYPKTLVEKGKSMMHLIDMTIQTVKKVSSELRPGLLDDLGLGAAIEWEVHEFQNRTGIQCEVEIKPEDIFLDPDLSTAIFRIVQEALTNVVRHAQATKVKVDLQKRSGNIIIKIRDNGKGIERKEIYHPKSLGLIGIRERVHFWGGKVMISGSKGKGTTLAVSIPLGR